MHCSRPKHVPPKRLMYDFNRADFDAYRDLLSFVPWDCVFVDTSINDNWMKLKDIIITAANECIPHTTGKVKKTKHWFSDETRLAIKKKRRLYRKARRTGKTSDFTSYRACSNVVRSLTRRDHCSHVDHLATEMLNSGNQKPFWRWLKSLMQR